LDARCLEGALGGISNTQKAFRIYISSPPKIIVSHDVKIDETVMYKMQKDNTELKWIETTKETPTPIADPMDDTTTNLTPETDPVIMMLSTFPFLPSTWPLHQVLPQKSRTMKRNRKSL
jgi:hypothetical protein